MASGSNLVVKISAVDATSAAIDSVAKRLAGITAPAKKVTNSLARLSDATGVTKLSKAIVHLGGTAVRTSERFVGALAPLGALTAALSVGGFAKMTSDWARFSQGLGFDATRIGANVSRLHALEGSATLAGSSAEAAANGLRTLQDTMTDTIGGRNMGALVAFRQLNVAFDDGRGHALRATAVLPKLADALSKISDRSIRARVGTVLLGGAYEELAPWIDLGSKGMEEYARRAAFFGVQTGESTVAARAFALAQGDLTLAFKGLGNSISEKVSPPLAHMMEFLALLVGSNRTLIADRFGSWAERFAGWIESIDWAKTFKYFGDLFDRFERWTDAMSKFTVPAWMKKLFGLGDDSPASGGAASHAGGVNGPLSDDNPNAPGSPAFYKAHPEIKAPDRSFFKPPALPPFWGWGSGSTAPQGNPDAGKRMMGYFESQGWTHAQAAGIVANLDRESGLTADKPGDGGQAYGLAQWHPDRQANFAKWAGHDIRGSTLDEQMRFVQYELTHDEKRAGDILKTTPNAATAAYVVNADYERPRDVAGENTIRGGIAQRYDTMKSDAPLIDDPLRRRLESQSKHEVVIKVQAEPGTHATTSTTGSGPATVRVERSMQ